MNANTNRDLIVYDQASVPLGEEPDVGDAISTFAHGGGASIALDVGSSALLLFYAPGDSIWYAVAFA